MGNKATALDNLKKAGKSPGRKGKKDKFTNLKESFLKAYNHKDGFGGDTALIKYAKDNKESFLQMVKGMLPKNVEMKSANELIITIESAIPEPKPRPKRESKP